MVYYPISTLLCAGTKGIMLITILGEKCCFVDLLGDADDWGIKIEYTVQLLPNGLAQAFILAEEFLDGANAALVLGDMFYRH